MACGTGEKLQIHLRRADCEGAVSHAGLYRRCARSSRSAGAYDARPLYQRNGYIGWITRAKREETRQKRLSQMLDELQAGNAYMGMGYNAK
ncbi:MAG: YdeI/OmpD-associated family protein [Christensenellaceae bacterium]|nr:YdeI/OmpD-associated family protein [Christensenellaceae bacterium]